MSVNTPNADIEVASTSEVKGTTNIQDVKSSTFINKGKLSSVLITDSNGTSFKNDGTVSTLNIDADLNNGSVPNVTISGSQPIGELIVKQATTLNVLPGITFSNPVQVKAPSTIVSGDSIPVIIDNGIDVTVKATSEDEGQVVTGNGSITDLVVAPVLSMQNALEVNTEEKVADYQGLIGKVFNTTGRTPIEVSLKKGTVDYSNVRIEVEGADTGIQLVAKDTEGNWYDIVKTGWGTPGGFHIADATTPVYVVANKAGKYDLTVKLVDVKDSNKVLATTKGTVTAFASEEAKVYRVTPKVATYNSERVGLSFQIDFKKADMSGTVNATNDFKVSVLDASDKVIATNKIISDVSLDRTTTYNGTSTTFYDNGKAQVFYSWNLGAHEGSEALNSIKKVKVEYTKDYIHYSKTFDVVLPAS